MHKFGSKKGTGRQNRQSPVEECDAKAEFCLKKAKKKEMDEPLKVKRVSSTAKLPVRATAGSAGYDIFASDDAVVQASSRNLVKTGLIIAIPKGCYGRIAPRSGLSFRFHIDVAAGVIDSDYRGAIAILLVNNGKEDFMVKQGDRVAQLLLERISTPSITEVNDLDETPRGKAGFGSTGA